jgi:GNAT superfamily N-acetyltransferase
MAISIRVAESGDAAACARLLHDFNTEYEDFTPGVEKLEPRIRELIEAGELTVLLAGDGPDGLAQLRFRPSVWNESFDACLEELYVVPPLRGGGVGRALLEAAMREAVSLGAKHLDLTTSHDDVAARGLYERCGFTNREGAPDGPVMFYYERDL